ncbi:MAG: hypothetical protein ACI9FB_003478 [Candidatus Azotimanducaceae bacterium]|jgi:hypothetical protein
MLNTSITKDLLYFQEIYILVDNFDRYRIFQTLFQDFPRRIVYCHTNVFSYLSARRQVSVDQKHLLLKRLGSRNDLQNLSIEEFKWNRRFKWSLDSTFLIASKKQVSRAWVVWGGFQYAWQCISTTVQIEATFYFEIANFPGKLQCSRHGINADGRYSDAIAKVTEKQSKECISAVELNKLIDTWTPPHADRRLIDQVLEQVINNVCSKFFKSLAPKISIQKALTTAFYAVLSRRMISKFKCIVLPVEYDLFIGQVSEDSQIVFQSVETQVSAIKKASLLAKSRDMALVLRLHPAEKNYTEMLAVVNYATLNGIVISNIGSLGLAIKNASSIYTVNSTGGAHAFIYHKPVTCFGRAFYEGWQAEDVCTYYKLLLIDQNAPLYPVEKLSS